MTIINTQSEDFAVCATQAAIPHLSFCFKSRIRYQFSCATSQTSQLFHMLLHKWQDSSTLVINKIICDEDTFISLLPRLFCHHRLSIMQKNIFKKYSKNKINILKCSFYLSLSISHTNTHTQSFAI